ncbi:MAG: CapA family protein [Thermoflexales bacterium]|nr:CapA family protein [Thermoflexales bacterium]
MIRRYAMMMVLFASVALGACSSGSEIPISGPQDRALQTAPPQTAATQPPTLGDAPVSGTETNPMPVPTLSPTLAPTPTPAALRVQVAPNVPAGVQASLQQMAQAWPEQFALVEWDADEPDLSIGVAPLAGTPAENVVATWVYALVVPFPSLVDEIPFTELQSAWSGSPGPTYGGSLFMSEETRAAFVSAWGEPAAGAVTVFPPAELADALWGTRPSWGIVPFEQLSLRLKVLKVDGYSPLARNLDVQAYPLALAVRTNGREIQREAWLAAWPAPLITNRDESKMTLLAMTGVTALTRTTAWKMERNGVLYPAEKIRDWLTSADIVHISNEVSFWEDCPPPGLTGMEFCSAPKYMEILTDVHTSIIELTGNHLNDYNWQPLSYTLGLYDQLGLPYYGGGRTVEEAQRAVTLTHNGNLLGFVGCNPVGPPIGWVNGLNDGRPGAAPCDDAVMQAEIQGLRAMGALPVATLQYWEFYHYTTTPQQVVDFRELVDFGAAIVSGSQGHHPQGFDFYGDGFIHYGVGNLFFGDQYDTNAHKMFVDRYLIYENRLLSLELLTGLIEDYSQPRPMTESERRELLQTVFAASGW